MGILPYWHPDIFDFIKHKAEDGKLEQTLAEGQAPLLTVAFSPNDNYVAASTDQTVLVWQRQNR